MVRGGGVMNTGARRTTMTGAAIGATRGGSYYGRQARGVSRYSIRGTFGGAFRSLGYRGGLASMRFGIRRQGFRGLSASRRQANISVDRRINRLYGTSRGGRGRLVRGGFRGRNRFVPRGGLRRGRGGTSFSRGGRGGRISVSGRGRGRGRGRGSSNVTQADLDSQLDAYMGTDATKTRLDNQLDAFFGRATQSNNVGVTVKPDPIGDSSDIAMNGAPLA